MPREVRTLTVSRRAGCVARSRARRRRRTTKAGAATQPARRRGRVAQGIYKDRHGLAATVKVKGIQREIRFPLARRSRPSGRGGTNCTPACGRSQTPTGTPSTTTPTATSTRWLPPALPCQPQQVATTFLLHLRRGSNCLSVPVVSGPGCRATTDPEAFVRTQAGPTVPPIHLGHSPAHP